MTLDEAVAWAQEAEFDFLTIDGHDSAFLGLIERAGGPIVACYSTSKILENLEAQGMDQEDALEYIEFNIAGAWVGDQTPFLFLDLFADRS